MVCGIYQIPSGDPSFCGGLHQVQKGGGSCLCVMDRLFQRHDSGDGSYEDGSEGDYFMFDQPYAAVYMLRGGISDAAVVFICIPGRQMEYVKDGELCIDSSAWNYSGVLC